MILRALISFKINVDLIITNGNNYPWDIMINLDMSFLLNMSSCYCFLALISTSLKCPPTFPAPATLNRTPFPRVLEQPNLLVSLG